MITTLVGSILLILSFFVPPHTSTTELSLEITPDEYQQTISNWLSDVHSPKAETLSFVIQAGDVLIFNLPTSIEGRSVDSYSIRKSPALSWIHERSFFWRTLAKDVGKHEILLSGSRNGVNTEELVIQVDIR